MIKQLSKFRTNQRFEYASLPIALKWSLVIACFITFAMGILGWILIGQQASFHQQQNKILGTSLVNQLARASSEPLLAQDDLALSLLVRYEEKEKFIIGIQVFDKEGTLHATEGVSAIWDIKSLLDTTPANNSFKWESPNLNAISYYSVIKYQ
jgi:adenylate cyclase